MLYVSNNWITSLLLTLVAVILYNVYRLLKHYDYWKNRGISGPKPYPIFGNLLSLRKHVLTTKLEWTKKYGKLYGIYYAFTPTLVISDPEVIKRITVKDFDKFRNKHDYGVKHAIIGLNLGSLRDEKWKRVRTIVTPTFSSAKLKTMYSSIIDSVKQLLDILDRYSTSGEDIDLKNMIGQLSANIILKQAFGVTVNTFEANDDNIFLKNIRNILDINALKMFAMTIMPRYILRFFKITVGIQSKPTDYIVSVMKAVIKERKHSNNKDHKDLLQLLINAEYRDTEQPIISHQNGINEDNRNEEENIKQSMIDGSNKLSENEVIAQTVAFYIAGFETTSYTLTYCLFELASNQQIQQTLYEEIKSVIDINGNISYDVLMQLSFLDAVLCETLRKYPIALGIQREAGYDYKVNEYNITIPKHQRIEIAIYSVHHDEQYFPNPETFIPSRFLPENRDKIIPGSYLPFSLGPRNCVGQRFALMEAKLVLALLVYRYKLSTKMESIIFKHDLRLLVPGLITIQIQKR